MISVKQRLDRRSGITINLRSLYSVVIGLLPVIMILKVPVINIGASTVLLGVFAPYALWIHNVKKIGMTAPFAFLFCYLILRSMGDIENQFLLLIVFIHVYGAINGSLDVCVIRKVLELVAVIATVCVLLQTIFFYLFGARIMFLVEPLILDANRAVLTLRGLFGTMYRPAAFFLEPSHYTQYCCLGLLSTLFPLSAEKANIKRALWIACGCILTTSGMGIALCIGVFGWYVLFAKRGKKTKIKAFIGWAIAAVAMLLVLMQFDFFSLALQRVFGEVDGYNAIWGRTMTWKAFVPSGKSFIIGSGVLDMPTLYATGLMELLYCYGLLGVSLLGAAFLFLFVKSKDIGGRCACVIYCGLMGFSNVFNFLKLSFWLCIIIASMQASSEICYETKQHTR